MIPTSFTPTTNTGTHPGYGLSLSQLIFALNQELKRTAYSPSYVTELATSFEQHTDLLCSFTFDDVSQLDQDNSTALATIREWRNSFIRVNRIPLDVLSLIPTHLSSHKDRLRASFVCRHWRRTFLQRAELWSELFLSKGDAYVKTFLERAKGSRLDVIASCGVPVDTMALLSPHTKQIRRLEFLRDGRANSKMFLQVDSGPLPLLHTLTINAIGEIGSQDPITVTPSPPFFSNAMNLRVFRFQSSSSRPSLSHFVFPNIVSFDLWLTAVDQFPASQLLEFLKASPMLQTVRMEIDGRISLDNIHREKVVVLPDAETLTLTVSDGRSGCKIATHISCPSAKSVTLMHKTHIQNAVLGAMFPDSASWNSIVRQYTRSSVEEVTLEIKPRYGTTACKIIFQSLGGSFIASGFEVVDRTRRRDQLPVEVKHRALTDAIRTILNHPQLASVKRLHICHSHNTSHPADDFHVANEIGRLFKSLEPLDELTIYGCDLHPYLNSFFGPSEERIESPIVFPPVKKLTISNPMLPALQSAAAIARLAKAQHLRGIPFECVAFHKHPTVFVGIEEMLRPWVGRVELHDSGHRRSVVTTVPDQFIPCVLSPQVLRFLV